MEIGDNTNSQPIGDTATQQSVENQATTGIFWCAVCDFELDENHKCWNTDYLGDGSNIKCPMYGLPQA